ncbi:hypothetical protein [Ectothiorhodospira shaposhnikovii]|uniref:hypothetical protein n=1 Tax=Ectothiorhodospira shaposhnikovii TaxID=1054 RepID=UPI001EE86D4A|nr:hypothetical protein [Ectothiorhodospira shaposhnikovii]
MSLLLVVACTGGGGSSSEGDTSLHLSGLVTDPPIEGAAVRLVNAQGDALSIVELTGSDGRFSVTLTEDLAREVRRILARGGIDTMTGQVLGNLMLSAPLEGGAVDDMLVSPLTTLVDRSMRERGMSRDQAVSAVASRLALNPAVVMADPASDASAQRASLLMTEILVALEGQADPWQLLDDAMDGMAPGRLDQAARRLALDLSGPVGDRLEAVAERADHLLSLDSAASAQEMIRALALQNLGHGLTRFFEIAGQPIHGDHLNRLSDALWEGMGERGVPAEGPALLNIIRYVFQVHEMPDDLSDPAAELPLNDIRHDVILRDLAALRVIDHTIPLAGGETLGMDNDARAAYFFRSDLSPTYLSERLFDGVLDDGVLDPMFRANAYNLAAAGLLDEAELTLRAAIFQPTERAMAQRQVAQALSGANNLETARVYWNASRQTYETALREGKGISNLDGDDAAFFQSLNSDLLTAGFREDADVALLAVREFIESQRGQPYTTAYGRIMVSLRDGASAAVDEAEATGLSGRAFNDALNAVDFFREATLGAGRQPLAGRCEAMKTLMVTAYADFYRRLGSTTGMRQAIDDFRNLATTDCNLTYGATMSPRMAPIHGELGDIQTYLAWIEEHVRPINESNADSARDNAVLYQALDRALGGDVEGAINQVVAQADTVQAAITQLTQVGTGANDVATPHLAVLLWRQGALDEARQVMDAAWELAMSERFVDELTGQLTSARNFLDQGCRKTALILGRMDQQALASERMRSCRRHVDSVLHDAGMTTDDLLWVAGSLAAAYQQLDMAGDAELIDRLHALGSVLSNPVARIRNLMEVALLRSSGGDPEAALSALDEAVEMLTQVATSSSDQAAINQALDLVAFIRTGQRRDSLMESYVRVAGDLRQTITRTGWADETQRHQVAMARERARMLASGDDALPGTWPGSLAMIDVLFAANDRTTQINSVVNWLASARQYETARMVAMGIETAPERHRQLLNIANGISTADDFPGTALARFDFDGDGRPDFFSPGSSAADRAASPLSLDDDIDGDGIPDTQDRTPYCAGCDA